MHRIVISIQRVLWRQTFNEAKLELARKHGADATVNTRSENAAEEILTVGGEILSKVVCGKKAHPRLITAKQLVLVAPLHR